ncbi:BamA/TamA family outer membrane protein [Culturomica massiliensis]|uniref:translocation and assembly module lipoprotein TamL n=1 Tax=Culturomica massiliensis TaxID=1841857 RepID=UPI00083808C2|nr:BamA/TamA family outer membrane protein [Culturomica massiliensis]
MMRNCILLSFFCLLFFSCSTTKKLTDGEVLYIGVKKMKIETPPKLKLKGPEKSALTSPMSYPPNNPLFAPYVRSPFPIGLWVYNWHIKKEKGLKWWLYRKLAKEPVLISDVQPELRLKMVENNMKDFGFFGLESRYEIIPRKRNPKKAKISYWVKLPDPFRYSSVDLWGWKGQMDSLVRQSMRFSLLKAGEQYDVNVLEQERQRISDILRNRGYYYFQPQYIEFLADTTRRHGEVDLRIGLKQGIPEVAFHPYTIRNVDVSLFGNDDSDRRDTLEYDRLQMDYSPPQTLKPKILSQAVKVRPGQLYTARRQNRTQSGIVQLGVFKFVNLTINPVDTSYGRKLDYKISADYALPIETEVEVDIASKSNNLLGPGLILSLNNKNMFKRAETFSLKLTGAYEWQVGGEKTTKGRSGLINSYELGVNLNLSVPRLLVPGFLKSGKDRQERTHFQIGTDFLNRHSYFRMISFWGSATYDFNSSRRNYHSVVPFKLNYTHLLRTSHEFDSTLNKNPAIALSFKDQFIPSMSYTYTFDRAATYRNPNRLFWQTSITQAGNIISGIQYLAGKRGEGREILGNRYSQFLKLTSEIIKYRQVSENSQVAMRLMGGIGYAYGNSRVMPYSEQFYIGGANSIRAFQIRSIGPGSYHPEKRSVTAYLDQTGDIKLEGNIGYRFKIAGRLNGAVFVDAGNVWLLRKEKERPGGEFRLKDLWREIALGTGFGLRYDITYIVIRADLGVALHAPYNTGKPGYFNIRNYDFRDGLVLNLAIGYPF